jgi:DNA-directed RNA polymerase subunit RPC12/RpoP
MQEEKELKNLRCSFCGRSHAEGVTMMITSELVDTGKAMICEECSMNIMFTFTRMKELREIARQQSNDAYEKFGRTDKDGNCTCRACTYQRLMETDHILLAIEEEQKAIRSGHHGAVLQ